MDRWKRLYGDAAVMEITNLKPVQNTNQSLLLGQFGRALFYDDASWEASARYLAGLRSSTAIAAGKAVFSVYAEVDALEANKGYANAYMLYSISERGVTVVLRTFSCRFLSREAT